MLVSNLEVSGSIIVHGGAITGSLTGSLIGQASGSFTGSFTGSYSGSGANLYDISASSIIGLNLSRISSGSVTASIDETRGFVVKSAISGSTFTGSINLISGSYSGSGANLSNIPASAIVGLNLSRISTGSVTASVDVNHGFVVKSSVSGSTFTGSIKLISGSYSGSGAQLSNIPASAVVGLNLNLISTGSATASLNIDLLGSSSFNVNTDTSISGSLRVGYRSGSGVSGSTPTSGTNIFGTASWAEYSVGGNSLSGSDYYGFINTGSSDGVQAITGSLIITQNLTVQGSSSFTYVTASQILLDQNTLTVFTSGTTLPKGGYIVADTSSWDGTSSFTNSSSFLYNTQTKFWTLGNSLIVSGTLRVTQSIIAPSITSSLEGTASWAVSASIATWARNAPRRFILPDEYFEMRENFEMYVYDLYNYGTLDISSGSVLLPFGTGSIRNAASVVVTHFYNAGIVFNNGLFQIVSQSL